MPDADRMLDFRVVRPGREEMVECLSTPEDLSWHRGSVGGLVGSTAEMIADSLVRR